MIEAYILIGISALLLALIASYMEKKTRPSHRSAS